MPLALLIAALALCLGAGYVQARVFLSQPQAIERAFPAARVERKTAFLTAEQAARIQELAGVKPDTRIVSYYVARDARGVQGIAFFARRVVRTLPVVFMAVLKPTGTVDRVELLSFEEPEDYQPPSRWLAIFRGRSLDKDLNLGRGIPRITGASLTSQSLTDGVRLILATYQVAIQSTL